MNDLIQQAKIDPEAFTELYRQHVDKVYKYFFFRMKSREEAEELTSDTWQVVVQKISQLKTADPISFRAWLFKIANNRLNEYYKRSLLPPNHGTGFGLFTE